MTIRARMGIAQGELKPAESDAHQALACAAQVQAHLSVPDTLECLASLAGQDGSHREAARLYGAAKAAREAWCVSKSTTPVMSRRSRCYVT